MCDEVIPDLGFAIDNGNIEYTCDQHTSLVLPGKGVQRYGEFQSENFVRLLEHFASNTSPTVPITGQLWYETTTGHECLRLYNGSSWTGNQDLDDGTLKFRDIKSAVSSDQDIVITANNTDDGLSISRTLALSAGKTIFAINRVDTTNLFRVEYNGTTYTSNSLTVDSNTNSFFYDKLIVNDTSVPSNQKSLSVNGDLLLYGSSSTGITLAISGTIRSDISVNSGGILKINYTSANGVTIGEGGGKLGVGIEPVAKLHVSSADSIQGRFEGSTDVGVELVSASSVVANYRYTGSKLYVSDTAAVTVLSNHASSRTIVGFGTDDATNKLQVFGNSKITGNLVMTGTITLAADPTLDLQVATKQYVDNATGATLDADLVAIAALAGTSGLLRKTAADTWSLDTTSYLSGTVGIGNGGTGQTTANDALNALLPSQSSNNGKVLQTNGTNASWVSVTGAPGGSDTQLQYNSSGSFAGATGLTTDGSSLTIGSTCTLNFGNFSTSGDAVAREYVARNTTTDATVTDLFLNGSSTRMVLANDSTWKFKIDIVARRTDADNESAAYTIEGCIDRNANAASTALVGSLLKTIVAEDTAAWDATAVADTTNGALVVQVTGEAAKTINWVAFIRTVEVIG